MSAVPLNTVQNAPDAPLMTIARDQTAPPSHAGLYALAIPQAQVHQLPGRDHQLNNDLSEVAEAIRISRPGPGTHT